MRDQLILGLLVLGVAAAPAQLAAQVPLTQEDSTAVMWEGLNGIVWVVRKRAQADRRTVTVRLDSTSVGYTSDELQRLVRDSLPSEPGTSEQAEYRLQITELRRASDSTAVMRVRLDRAGEGRCPILDYAVFIVRRGGAWEHNLSAHLNTDACPHVY